jgi:hypothetical protein
LTGLVAISFSKSILHRGVSEWVSSDSVWYQCLGGPCCLHLQYTISKPRRPMTWIFIAMKTSSPTWNM